MTAAVFGADDAAATLAAFLRVAVPAMLTNDRTARSLSLADLPDPKLITSSELPEIPVDSWPAIVAVPERVEQVRAVGYGETGHLEYDVQYRVAVECYVRAQGFEATGRMNRRYAAAVRAALLANRTLKLPQWSAARPRIDAESYVEEYTPTFEASRGRTIASSRATFTLRQLEATVLPDAGQVATTHIDTVRVGPTSPMPVHPAL